MNASRLPSILAFAFLISVLSCTPANPDSSSRQDDSEKNTPEGLLETDGDYYVLSFDEAKGNVINPERGFYYPYTFSSSSKSLSTSEVKSKRKAGHTILFTQYRLDKWMTSDLPDDLISSMQKTFDALREGGAKCILRFCYKQNNSESSKPWDAEEKWVMRHIEQVKPLLQKNEDVILVYQAGYIGVWGEWYFTDHYIMEPETPEDYLPRKRVLDAMLDALPPSRQVAVRTPDFKMMMYGLSLADTLTSTTAHNGEKLSRIGGYNDCFGASEDDSGTYVGKDARKFWNGDTRYTFMGGETCEVSAYCECPVSLSDMEKYHWTYLNIDYNEDVLRLWKKSECYDEIARRLGYRIVMESVRYPINIQAGKPFNLTLNFRNDGFAAFQNPREAKLVFMAENGEKSIFDLGSDPRTWHPGSYSLKTTLTLPAAKGTLFLHLADPLLPDQADFSAALANQDVWDASTGYNKLLEIK